MKPNQERIDVETAEFGACVRFNCDYDAGNWIIPKGTPAEVRNELSPDREWITEEHHVVEVDLNGSYHEVEVPYEVLGMQ